MARGWYFRAALMSALVTLLGISSAWADPDKEDDDDKNKDMGLVEGTGESTYAETKLVAFVPSLGAPTIDPNLVNSWGLAATSTSFWWVADNGTGLATLYDGNGAVQPLVVNVTGDGGSPAAPTGVVAYTGSQFKISAGGVTAPAAFIFDSEDGTISAWSAGVPPPPPAKATIVVVDHPNTAVYKGLALDAERNRLYAANFRAGTVEAYDGSWNPILQGKFKDPKLPSGYAPFGIRSIGGRVFVTYALQNAAKHDDVKGPGHGFVDEYSPDGKLLRRVASQGSLNSPWGLALAPDGFGSASGHLLVGNFGDGRIQVIDFEPESKKDNDDGLANKPATFLRDASGQPIVIDGLWGLGFGNGNRSGPANTLYFASGPNDEADGLYGRIDLVLPK